MPDSRASVATVQGAPFWGWRLTMPSEGDTPASGLPLDAAVARGPEVGVSLIHGARMCMYTRAYTCTLSPPSPFVTPSRSTSCSTSAFN